MLFRSLALDIDIVADMGSYLSAYAPYIPYLGAGMSPGVYDIPACFVRLRAAYTHTIPVDAYRGAGRPEASYVIERLVDAYAGRIVVERAGEDGLARLWEAERTLPDDRAIELLMVLFGADLAGILDVKTWE